MQPNNSNSGLKNLLVGVGVALLVFHVYYYCYGLLKSHYLTFKMIDRFVLNLTKSGLFRHVYTSKAIALTVLFIAMCMARPGNNLRRPRAKTTLIYGSAGMLCYFGSAWLMVIRGDPATIACCYIGLILAGLTLTLFAANALISALAIHFSRDVFNTANETFPQEEMRLTNPWSVNLPAKYRLRNASRHSWINCIDIFRGVAIWGSPGSGKTYFIVRHFISQLLQKKFCLFVYDFKFDDLSRIAYNNLIKYQDNFPVKPAFFVVDFDHPEKSNRCNPLDPASMVDISDAADSARTILLALNPEWIPRRGDFFIESAIVFTTAVMWFLRKYQGGKYCTLPHLIELMQVEYDKLFTVLRSVPEVESLISTFVNAFINETFETLDSQTASAKIALSGLTSPQLYYILSGNEFSLDLNNPRSPKLICIGSSPQKQQTYGAVVSLYISRIGKLINKKDQLPCALILDELSTIYPAGIPELLATGRSNRVGVVFTAQSISLLRKVYGQRDADMLFNLPGNVFCGQANGDTAKAMSDCFGKILQPKQSVSINSRENSVNNSEQLDLAVPASKITTLSSGEFVGIVADNPGQKIKLKAFHAEILSDHPAIAKEEAAYQPLPSIRTLAPDTIENNFLAIKKEVDSLVNQQIHAMSRNPILAQKIIHKSRQSIKQWKKK